MKKVNKNIILIFVFVFIFANTATIFALNNQEKFKDKPCTVYSNEIPKVVSEFAQTNFQTLLEQPRQASDGLGLQKTHINEMYLGQGFNIFEINNGELIDQNIYYYPVMYNDRVEAIFTIGINSDGSCYSTLGTDFAKQLQNAFDKFNDNTPFILISSDQNIYIQNKKGSYPIFIYHQNKINNLSASSFSNNIKFIEKTFKNKTLLNVNKKFETKARDINKTYTYKELTSNATTSNITTANLTSTWLSLAIVNQRDHSGEQRGMCWAASTAAILNFKKGYHLDATNICDLMRTGYDDGGSPDLAKAAMQYYGVTTARVTVVLSDTAIENYINNNTPIYMSSKSATDGHATVIRGYMVGSGYIQISMMNPATETYQAAYGSVMSYSYVMGNTTYTWRSSVVYN